MSERSDTGSTGRQAGIAYLVIIVFSLLGYPTLTRLLAGDPQLVPGHVTASQTLFTLGFIASGIGFAAWIAVGLLLYRILRRAGETAALLLLAFAVAGTAMNMTALIQLLPLVIPAGFELNAVKVTPMVEHYNRLLLLAQVFSGLWLLPFAWLVFRSRVAPRLLALCLAAGGVFYLLIFATAFEPDLGHSLAYQIVSVPTGVLGFIGELGMCLWLLIKGASVQDSGRSS
ncbi:MAG TPA: DUF4386 domain-containing protein [Steroidobacteraceae bacterium]|jgi:hypothetical protein